MRKTVTLTVAKDQRAVRSVNCPPWKAVNTDSGLTSITLPGSLKKLGGNAFGGTGLTSLTPPASLEEMGKYVVSGCEKLTIVTFPTSGKAVEALRDTSARDFLDLLGQCPALEEIVNPASERLAQRLETYHSLFEGVDPALWVVEQSDVITAKSNEITAGLSGDYEKARAIHRWVAQNITYDYEYFRREKDSTWSRPGNSGTSTTPGTLTLPSSFLPAVTWPCPPRATTSRPGIRA